jgi:hypothetical protein
MRCRIEVEAAIRSGAIGCGNHITLSHLARRVVQENQSTPIATRNTLVWAASNEAAERWRSRHVELLKSSAAPVDGNTA